MVGGRSTVARAMLALGLASCGGGAATTTIAPTTTTESTPVPASIPAACDATSVTTVPLGSPVTTIAANPLTAEQQAEVLAAFDAVVRDSYLYPEAVDGGWADEVATVVAAVDTGIDTMEFYSQLKTLVTTLGDEHSHFETPAEVLAAEQALAASNDFVGIGVLVVPQVDEDLFAVVSVVPGSPAEQAGIRSRDAIHAVDGQPVDGSSTAATNPLRGPECSLIILSVTPPGGETTDLAAVRYRVEGAIPIVSEMMLSSNGRRIGYVMIPTLFDETIDDQVAAALEGFGELDGLVLDLRLNAGGSSRVLEPLLGLFTSGLVGEFRGGASPRPLLVTPTDAGNSQTVPLAVLVGEDTVSYAEVFSGTLGVLGRAVLVGTTTEGNVETLRGFELPDGSKLWLAAERFYPASAGDIDWERDGIVPEVIIAAEWWQYTFESDPAIAAAVAALSSG